MLKLKDGRKELYQWDAGVVADVTVDNIDEVHFSNLRYGISYNVEVKNGTVNIPPEVLQSGADVFCWAFVRQENGGYTKKEQIFNVEKRPRPADYIYEPTEILTWQKLEQEMEKVANKSTDIEADRDSKIKYPNVADILEYIDHNDIQTVANVNLSICESGVYLTNTITYNKTNIPQPFTEMLPSKGLLNVEKTAIGIYFYWLSASFIIEGLSNSSGKFDNDFKKYELSKFATKEAVAEVVANVKTPAVYIYSTANFINKKVFENDANSPNILTIKVTQSGTSVGISFELYLAKKENDEIINLVNHPFPISIDKQGGPSCEHFPLPSLNEISYMVDSDGSIEEFSLNALKTAFVDGEAITSSEMEYISSANGSACSFSVILWLNASSQDIANTFKEEYEALFQAAEAVKIYYTEFAEIVGG